MLIVCPNCATSYDVDVASLRPNGRRVRCVRCRTVWLGEPSHADKLVAAAEQLAPARWAVEAAAEVASAGTAPDPALLAAAPTDPGEEAEDSLVVEEPAEALPADPADDKAGGPAAESSEMESPSIVPGDSDADHAPADLDSQARSEPIKDVESFAARRLSLRLKRQHWLRWPLTQLQTVIMALIVIDAVVVGWRADFVRLMPQTASFYAAIGMPVNLRGLNFDGLKVSTEQHEGVPILVLEGAVVNDTRKWADVPHLRFAVRNAARQEIYSWNATPPRATLPPGEAATFRTRLASPPPDARDVLVRFLNRRDMMNGNR